MASLLTVDEAVNAAHAAQMKVEDMSLEERGRMISIIRRDQHRSLRKLGPMELEETKVGRLDHKIQKLKNMKYVLGVEAMHSEAAHRFVWLAFDRTRAVGRHWQWSLPVTHAVPTMVANAINILAAGNTAIFAPAPVGQARLAVRVAALQP